MSNNTYSLTSPAKLNLFLRITGKRDDGYHNLQTLFVILDEGDKLEFSFSNSGIVEIIPEIPEIPIEQNLVYKAAIALKEFVANPKLGVKINLVKRIPMGGGLGGGSSNAATVLLGLNKLWNLNLSQEQLMLIGRKLGADVPVFIGGHTAFAQGIGEKLQNVDILEKWYVVLRPQVHISTKDIFTHPDLIRNSPVQSWEQLSAQPFVNDCEPLVRKLYPIVDETINWLSQYAPTRLTGTGSCVFAEFSSKDEALKVIDKIPTNISFFVAKGSNVSKTIKELEQI